VAQLIVRNLPDELVKALKLRAAENMRSAEEEHREILKNALAPAKPSLKSMLAAMPDVGDDADFAREQDDGRPVDL
jgi:plasmid stability protein